VDVGIEAAVRRDLLESLAFERRAELASDELDAFLELRLLVLRGRVERPLEIVEDREERLHEPLVRVRDDALALADRPLPVVLEVGREPLEVGEVRVALGLGLRDSLLELLELPLELGDPPLELRLRDGLLGH
jgi:hypothetical protein